MIRGVRDLGRINAPAARRGSPGYRTGNVCHAPRTRSAGSPRRSDWQARDRCQRHRGASRCTGEQRVDRRARGLSWLAWGRSRDRPRHVRMYRWTRDRPGDVTLGVGQHHRPCHPSRGKLRSLGKLSPNRVRGVRLTSRHRRRSRCELGSDLKLEVFRDRRHGFLGVRKPCHDGLRQRLEEASHSVGGGS